MKVHCAALSQGLLESELFGHVKGAFTGAVANTQGLFASAEGGTLFLDEITEIPTTIQVKLLRTIQEREVRRVGDTRDVKINVRLIAASNRDLGKAVADGVLREDLFYRLNVIPIQLPPLRERREDIPLLVAHFIQKLSGQLGKHVTAVAPDALSVLERYHWPGNIRELQNLLERAVILSPGPTLRVPLNDLHVQSAPIVTATAARKAETLEEVERRHILETLDATDWVISGPKGAATTLGLKRSTLQARMEKLGIRRARAAAAPMQG